MTTGFTDLLNPTDCGRRALSETIADWREERSSAASGFDRIAVDVRTAAGILRVFSMVAGEGLLHGDVWRFLLCTTLAAAVLGAFQLIPYAAAISGTTVLEILSLFPVAMVVSGVVTGAFGAGLQKDRPFPGLPLILAALSLMVLAVGFVVPEFNQYYRETVFARLADSEATTALPRGTSETNAVELVRLAMNSEGGSLAARRALEHHLAVILAAPAMLLLGAALRARISTRRGWRTSQIAGGIGAFVIFICGRVAGAGLGEVALAAWPSLYRSDLQTLPWWCGIATSLIVTLSIVRRRPAER